MFGADRQAESLQRQARLLDHLPFRPAKYGGGKVIVWDKGTWHPVGDPEQGYRDGNLKFEMRGHKIVGRWALSA
jgi:hypothetical protein